MPRQMLVNGEDGPGVLKESLAHNEAQLQSILRDNPGLLPIEDFDLVGPPLVLGKETSVPSGSIDLVLIARGGELILVEFKTGPQNPDFRGALAQVLDYGSDLWQMTLEEFERKAVLRYFAGTQAAGTALARCHSLDEAIALTWPDLSDEELASFKERLSVDLSDGTFTYVVAAQKLTDAMSRTAQYLNVHHKGSRFFLVEMVRFTGDGASSNEVFEARTVLRPDAATAVGPRGSRLTRDALIEQIADEDYAEAIGRILDAAESTGLRISWGTTGLSLRLPNPEGGAPASVAWINPPGAVGWMGLTDLVLGYDQTSPAFAVLKDPLERYVASVDSLGGDPLHSGTLTATHFSPAKTTNSIDQLATAIEQLGESSL